MKKVSILFPIYSLFVIGLLFFAACSKDDNPEPTKKEKVFRVTIEHEGDINQYIGILTISSALDKDMKAVSISGVAWDEETQSGEYRVYSKTYDPVTESSITFKTDKEASMLQFGFSAFTLEEDVETPMTSTIKYFVDDKLVKTETYESENGTTGTPYLGEIDANDY